MSALKSFDIIYYRKFVWRLLKSIIRILLGVYIGLSLVLYLMQSHFIFRPAKEMPYNPGNIDLEYENVQIKTPDNLTLSAWFIPAKDAKFTVLFCHGNGGNISHRLESIRILNDLQLNCLFFDYRGYGSSQGKPSEEGFYNDANAAYDWLINEKKIPSENIIIYGQSLGASVAAHLENNTKTAGLIIESGFTSFPEVAGNIYPYMPVKYFAKYRFNTIDYLKKVNCPVLIIHSRDDELVPFKLGRRLYEQAAKEPKQFIEISGSHNEGFFESEIVCRQGISNWLKFIENYQAQAASK